MIEWIKVNTDGSYLYETGKSGVGGVFCNTQDFSLGCFAFPTGNALAYVAELKAVVLPSFQHKSEASINSG